MREGKKEEAENRKAEVAVLKDKEKELKEQVTQLEKKQFDTVILLPNLPTAAVPKAIHRKKMKPLRKSATSRFFMRALFLIGSL